MLFGKRKPPEGPQWLVVGLGNPGDKYEGTRHNVGFEALEALADDAGVSIHRLKYKSLTAACSIGGQKVLLMKPVTYMNLSGEAVRQAADFFKIPPERVLVISDDVALTPGKLRIRLNGSAGGHNGLKSIIQHLGTDQFPRVKIGVGDKPHAEYDMADWVLSKFTGEDKKTMAAAAVRAADGAVCFIAEGAERAMNKYN